MSSPEAVINEVTLPKKKHRWISKTICMFLLSVSVVLFFAARWYIGKFGNVGFDSILFTIFSNVKGAQTDEMVTSFLIRGAIPSVLIIATVGYVLFFFSNKRSFSITLKKKNFKLLPLKHHFSVIISVMLSFVLLISAAATAGLTNYVYSMVAKTEIFDEEYVDPMSVGIEFPEQKRNLIYIFLESMETTYFSKEDGGGLEYNLIPELYSMAENNVNFSHNDGIGGLYATNGATWTVAAMTAHSSGVPLKAPRVFSRNSYGSDNFLPGLNTLSDVLAANGYFQALMVGSTADFANRDVFYRDHGVNEIYDLTTARAEGFVPPDYHDGWWGLEDANLFRYAQQKLTEMSTKDQPFALTMLTVDTHMTGGHLCFKCENKYEEKYENVLSCSSHQVDEFVNWIKQQDFYKDTTIVIVGDHLTMDSEYIGRNVQPKFDRRVYNCIINSAVEGVNYKNRQATTLDMFPTTLAAMGCKIEGERLGLGTNLFSDKETLSERMGYDDFNYQISYNSNFYNDNFLGE